MVASNSINLDTQLIASVQYSKIILISASMYLPVASNLHMH